VEPTIIPRRFYLFIDVFNARSKCISREVFEEKSQNISFKLATKLRSEEFTQNLLLQDLCNFL